MLVDLEELIKSTDDILTAIDKSAAITTTLAQIESKWTYFKIKKMKNKLRKRNII